MSVVNNNSNSKVISNSSSNNSISSSSSTTTKKSTSSTSATINSNSSNNSSNNVVKKNHAKKEQQQQEHSVSSSTSSSEIHHFEEEDKTLIPPAISFTTLITDYETELMAFMNRESDTSRSPSPQPQPDLLLDIQHDDGGGGEAIEQLPESQQLQQVELKKSKGAAKEAEEEEDQILTKGDFGSCNSKKNDDASSSSKSIVVVENLIDESAKMIINNKNLLLLNNHDHDEVQGEEAEEDNHEHDVIIIHDEHEQHEQEDGSYSDEHDYHDLNNEHYNSLTSTTTLDTVIAVDDLASVVMVEDGSGSRNSGQMEQPQRQDSGEVNGQFYDHDKDNQHEHILDLDSSSSAHDIQTEVLFQGSYASAGVAQQSSEEEEQEMHDDDDFDKIKQQESMSFKTNSSKKISSTSSSMVKQTSVEKIQQIQSQQQQQQQQIQQKKNEVIKASSTATGSGKTSSLSSTSSGSAVQESVVVNNENGANHVEAAVNTTTSKESVRVKEQDGMIKQRKKTSNSSISVHQDNDADDENDESSSTISKFEEYEIKSSSAMYSMNTVVVDSSSSNNVIVTNNTDTETQNGFDSPRIIDHDKVIQCNSNNSNKTNGLSTTTNNEDEDVKRKRKYSKEQQHSPAPLHELDDNDVFNFVSVSKLKSSFTKFDNMARANNNAAITGVKKSDSGSLNGNESNPTTPQESPLDKKPNEHVCKCCGKIIFVMELIRAEKTDWHKTCFRCTICKKTLGVDNYCSNEGILYCKPHFRELFQPKPVFEAANGEDEALDEETRKKKRAEIIIRESEPIQLPPDVVKSTVDDTTQRFAELEELNNSLDVKSKFELFQTLSVGQDQEHQQQQLVEPVKRSSSAVLASRVAKYQSLVSQSAMESVSATNAVGVLDSELGPHIPEGGIKEGANDDSDDDNTPVKILPKKIHPTEEINFDAVDSVRSKWESNGFNTGRKEEARKEEQIKFRTKLLHGKNNQLKEMYEKAVVESSTAATSPSTLELLENGEGFVAKAKELKGIFESVGDESSHSTKQTAMLKDEIFESEITKSSRNLFKELDKSASTINFQNQHGMMKSESKTGINTKAQHHFDGKDIVRSSDVIEEIVAPSDISNKFQFFEKYTDEQKKQNEKKQFRITPPREGQVKESSPEVEIYRDPNIVRACDNAVDAPPVTNTASKMLSVFRQLEEAEKAQIQHNSYKPLKEFTPPRETRPFTNGTSSSSTNGHGVGGGQGDYEDGDDYDSEEEQQRASINSTVQKDEILKEVGSLARASSLRAKFEVWNDSTSPLNNHHHHDDDDEGDGHEGSSSPQNENIIAPSIDTTKNLRAKFEKICEVEESALNSKKDAINKRPVKRFVELTNNSEIMDTCDTCEKKVYAMEKLEAGGKVYHKTCFRCSHCKCVLRMDTFTSNRGILFCKTHFKQLFKIKGNYDEGFGYENQKREWEKKNKLAQSGGGASSAGDENEKEN